MICPPFDLRDYVLKELADGEQRQVDSHLKGCAACREEVERLRLTEAALLTLREEEIPQRIAFVSDKIFEPSPWRRRWAAFWNSGARLGFASAAMLSAALVVFAVTRPAVYVAGLQTHIAAPPVATSAAASEADIQQRIQAAVDKAVAQSEARQSEKTKQLVSELEHTRQRLLLAADEYEQAQKRANVRVLSANIYNPPAADSGDLK